MKHLPPVKQSYEPVLVPYTADRDYDCPDFAGYPSRQGWDINHLLAGVVGQNLSLLSHMTVL